MPCIKELSVNTIRMLSAEGVQKANSGHPGLPMGSAPMAYALWAEQMKHNPKDPKWINRDRFVLSAGHGSMLLYSLLHLFGYGLTIEDLQQFRQWGSKTPGHPEYGHTVGVETTTGPLGMGVANAVGMAVAEAHLAAKFNREGYNVMDHYTYALVGDGCLMEGISSEASSLAGTWGLGKLIVLYDSNTISIEGNTNIAFREDVAKRFEAYGWQVIDVADGTDVDAISAAIAEAKKETGKPSLIVVHTEIGYGCPAKQGKASAHGEPLGEENLEATRKNLGWNYPPFTVPEEVKAHMQQRIAAGAKAQDEWNVLFDNYKKAFPELAKEWDCWFSGKVDESIFADESYWDFPKADATRNSSGIALNRLAAKVPNLIGGSADLAPSTKTLMKDRGDFSAEDYSGSNMHFGVREFAMAAIGNGMVLHGGLRAYVSTFFVFSDYMKHAIRLSAIMQLPLTYVLTHDSIGVGEDGPTHEPIEQLAMLRSIPGMTVLRPADGKETAAAWQVAMTHNGPCALVLTRQNLPQYENTGCGVKKGAYILADSEKATPDVILMATGSEVELIMKAKDALKEKGVDARVVSMPSFELFDAQDEAYKESVLPKAVRARVAVEAASPFGWYKYVGLDGEVIALDHFGASAPASILFKEFGFTVDNVVEKALAVCK